MKFRSVQIYYPTGLLYVASYLRKHGYDVKVIDAPASNWEHNVEINDKWYMGLTHEEILNEISKYKPDVIGMSITFSINAEESYALATDIRKKFTDIPLVAGGAHCTVKPIECMGYFDNVIQGEGEFMSLQLIEALKNKSAKRGIMKGNVISDIDSIPFPARDLIPMNEYFRSTTDPSILVHGIRGMDIWITLITSRGCPFNCSFCVVYRTMGRKWRPRSPENVLSEIEHLVNKYKITDIVIEDDNATLKPDRMEKICDEIIDRKYKLKFYTPNGIRADTLDRKLMVKMKLSGFKEIWIAPESGVQRVVDNVIGKHLDLNKVEEVVKTGKDIGMDISCFFVVGNPGETYSEIMETIQFARKLKKLGMHRYAWGYATPYWGTRLYKMCKDKGYLIDNFNNNSISPHEPSIITPEWSEKDIKKVRQLFTVS